MEKSIKQVEEFYNTFDMPYNDKPAFPSEKRCILRIDLLKEELKELEDAINNNDLVEAADALMDIKYILNGTILEFGFGELDETLFDDVHRSNMSKACTTEEDAIKTIQHYKENYNTDSYKKEFNGKWLVYRKEDDKLLKSINYSKVKLNELI